MFVYKCLLISYTHQTGMRAGTDANIYIFLSKEFVVILKRANNSKLESIKASNLGLNETNTIMSIVSHKN